MAIDGPSSPADALPPSCALYKLSLKPCAPPFAPTHALHPPSSRLRCRHLASRRRDIAGNRGSLSVVKYLASVVLSFRHVRRSPELLSDPGLPHRRNKLRPKLRHLLSSAFIRRPRSPSATSFRRRSFADESLCGKGTVSPPFSLTSRARSIHRNSPAAHCLPPRTGCPGRHPSRPLESLDEFALFAATSKAFPRWKPSTRARFWSSPAILPPHAAVSGESSPPVRLRTLSTARSCTDGSDQVQTQVNQSLYRST
jgi:hypothetical protein